MLFGFVDDLGGGIEGTEHAGAGPLGLAGEQARVVVGFLEFGGGKGGQGGGDIVDGHSGGKVALFFGRGALPAPKKGPAPSANAVWGVGLKLQKPLCKVHRGLVVKKYGSYLLSRIVVQYHRP